MTVQELIDKLQKLPKKQKAKTIVVNQFFGEYLTTIEVSYNERKDAIVLGVE